MIKTVIHIDSKIVNANDLTPNSLENTSNVVKDRHVGKKDDFMKDSSNGGRSCILNAPERGSKLNQAFILSKKSEASQHGECRTAKSMVKTSKSNI